MLILSLIVAAVALALPFVLLRTVHTFVVGDVEHALLIRSGRCTRRLEPGLHRVLGCRVELQRFDAREMNLQIAPQEITTGDPMSVKASATLRFRIVEPERVREASTQYLSDLYVIGQVALRKVLALHELESLLADRSAASEQLLERVKSRASELGIEVVGASVLDLIVRGDLKKALGEALQARVEAQAKLERARGETAALRHLNNAAKLIEKNVGLARLRLLDTLQSAAEGTGNSIVLGVSGGIDLGSTKESH